MHDSRPPDIPSHQTRGRSGARSNVRVQKMAKGCMPMSVRGGGLAIQRSARVPWLLLIVLVPPIKAYDVSTTSASMAPSTDRPVAEPGTDCG